MKTKSKVILSISVLCLIVAISTLGLVSVWAASQQKLKTDFNVGYVAKEVRGTATAEWKVGEDGEWNPMTTDGTTTGIQTLTFAEQELETANLLPTEETIELDTDNDFAIFKYTFTNTGNNAYSVELTFDATSATNVETYVSAPATALTSDFKTGVANAFSGLAATNINPGTTKSMYIRAQVTDTESEANFDGTFNFVLDGTKKAPTLDELNFSTTGSEVTVTGFKSGYESTVEEVVIPETYNGVPVTTIGYRAFYQNEVMTSVDIPSSVTSIGNDAFDGCSALKTVNIPANSELTNIGNTAFYYCFELANITLPNSLVNIGEASFMGCGELTSIDIPNGVEIIEDLAFCDCSGLTSVTIPSSVESIGYNAFYNCSSLSYNTHDNANYLGNGENLYLALIEATSTSITSCDIHPNTKIISGGAFMGRDGLTSITIPSSVTSIGENAFGDCSGLISVTILEGVTSIGGGAFAGCSRLTSITIPSSVTSIGDAAFYECSGLIEVTIESETVCNDASMISYAYITDCAKTIKAKYAISGLSGYTSQGQQNGYYVYTKN